MQLLNRGKRRFDSSDILPLFAVITLGLHGVMALLTLSNTISISNLAKKPAPSMVQTVEGKAITMQPVDHLQRTPETIHQFVKNSLALMFTWNAQMAVADPDSGRSEKRTINDPGVSVGDRGGKVTTSSWQASYAFSEEYGFREKLLAEVAKLTPSEVFAGGGQSVLSFVSVSNPKPLENNVWRVDVVANLLVFDGNHPQGMPIAFNKKVFVKAIEPTPNPLPDKTTAIQKAVYRLQENGLAITDMQDLDPQSFTR